VADPRESDVEARYRSRSLWLDTFPGELTPRPALEASIDVDVAIVGAGLTGLWTAYELLGRAPDLRVAIVEAEIAGFGASGRNGGWCSALFAGSRAATERAHGRDAAVALQRAMFATVDEVGRVLTAEGIDAHFHKGGTLELATRAPHLARLQAHVDSERDWGFGPGDIEWLDADAASARIAAAGVLGGVYTPHCARVHPARLVRGLAAAVERRGATIYERSRVVDLAPGTVGTSGGRLRAEQVVLATEGYTARLPAHGRRIAPVYSLMIATEPLPARVWDEIGWSGRETLADGRHLIIYAQRTADDRIAFGGRGAPYHFGSRIRDDFDRDRRVFADLRAVLTELFPAVAGACITHEWGGPLGIPRDWYSSVGFDRGTGVAWAGGYVGDGVSTTNLAGRTLADLLLGIDSDLTALPWVNHRSPDWEPEPLRWLGINAGLALPTGADRHEARTGRPSRWRERLLARLVG
jgi:glycine/D-amino acid oxidase-like deaminating enzyme